MLTPLSLWMHLTAIGRTHTEGLNGAMTTQYFKIGDHVSWNSEAGRVSGTIIGVHTQNVNYKGYIHHATSDDPQYEIKSDKTSHIAMHKGSALRQD